MFSFYDFEFYRLFRKLYFVNFCILDFAFLLWRDTVFEYDFVFWCSSDVYAYLRDIIVSFALSGYDCVLFLCFALLLLCCFAFVLSSVQ